MPIRQKSVDVVPLTPELAKEFAALTPLPGERALKAKRKRWIERLIKDDSFLGVTWYKGIKRETGAVYRLDGQHSSNVLANLPPERFPESLKATVTTWEFDHADTARVFDFFNNPASARTNVDVMGVYRAEFDDPGATPIADIPRERLVQITNGINAYNAELEDGFTRDTRTRGAFFADPANRAFARWVQDEFGKCRHPWVFARNGVVAEMLADYIASKQVATEFWGHVLNETHPDPDHESRQLLEQLKKWKGKPSKTADIYRKFAQKMWSRYARLRTLELEKAGSLLESRQGEQLGA